MVIKNVCLETVCGITSKLPENPYREVAFAGKSNVGKSSLINALLNRKALARTSSQPGKTQTINFYNVNDALYLVDLPGYGYASANVEIKAKWGKMIERYLHSSKQLAAVFLLIDIRHAPSENDRMMYEWMVYQGFAPIIIATKMDKLNKSQIPKHLDAIRDGLAVQPDTKLLPFSAETKQGREEIWELIEELTLPEEISEEPAASEAEATAGRTPEASGAENGSRQSEAAGVSISGGKPEENGAGEKKKKPRWKSIGRENPAKARKAAKDKRAGKKK